MMTTARRFLYFLAFALALAPAGWTAAINTGLGALKISKMASGLKNPWAIAFLPDGGFLITLRGGEMRRYNAAGNYQKIEGLPPVYARGQGGLLDVALAKDFKTSRRLYLSYSTTISAAGLDYFGGESRGSATALAAARLSTDGARLEEFRIIFQMNGKSTSTRHFGSRIVNVDDEYLFLTIGDRGDRPEAQNLNSHNGAVIRVRASDGKAPADNPFAGKNALPEIWSFGHRNPQGAALDEDGALWVVEHGARGGDEINKVEKGANYGWPVISYGTHYTGFKIGEGTHKEGMRQPAFYWDPSIAPSGMMIYSGKLFPEWRGDIFVGSLKFDYLSRVRRQDGGLAEAEQIKGPETARVRDVREAADGSIWFLSEDNGAVYKIHR